MSTNWHYQRFINLASKQHFKSNYFEVLDSMAACATCQAQQITLQRSKTIVTLKKLYCIRLESHAQGFKLHVLTRGERGFTN